MPLSVAEKTKQDIVELLYAQSIRLTIVHPIAAAMMVFWFQNFAPLNNLLVWFAAISILSLFRPLLQRAFLRYHNDDNTHLWTHAWVAITAILGSIYSAGFIYFSPVDNDAYLASIGMCIIGLGGAAIISYGASKYAVWGFFLPVTLPSVIYFAFYGGEAGLMLSSGLVFYCAVVMSLIRNVSEAFKKSILLNYQYQQEIDKRKQIEKQLQDISRRDGLTGLFNRRYFDEVLNTEIGRAHRNHLPLCLLMFDVDYFKDYNDTYGHVAGDNCLITIAEIASTLSSRKGDLIARYGGEEFAIILPNIDMPGALAFAEKLQAKVQSKRIKHETTKLTTLKSVTISVGVTQLMPFKKVPASELIDLADKALYEAKKQGRNRVHGFENNGIDDAF